MKKYQTLLWIASAISVIIPAQAQSPFIGKCAVFPSNNIWNTPVDQLPVASTSATYVNTIGPGLPLHPDFGPVPYGIPVTTVPGTQTKYPATFVYSAESDPGPYAIPLDAPIQGGSQSTGDRHVIAVDTDNCIAYEMFGAYPQATGWKSGSGAIFDLSSNALRTAGWTSADAAGTPMLPGLIRYDEIAAGEIRHAIEFTVAHSRNSYVWPARHFASSLTGANYPPMGTRFRLRANYDISGFSPTNQIILKALKKYGMIIVDNGASWFITGATDPRWSNSDLHALTNVKGSDFEQVDVSSLMVDPNSGEARQGTITAPVSVTIAPASQTLKVNATAQFQASVHNASSQAVTWSVNGIAGGNATVGTIGAAGLYRAPANAPSPATVTIRATSSADSSASGTATVTVAPNVSISLLPLRTTVPQHGTIQFTAHVQGTANQNVTWQVNGFDGGIPTFGLISASGVYTAPAVRANMTVRITAVSVADPTVSANALLTVAH
ncbi:MAG TPA: hypothetical protein VHB50_21425 [Bryobacteraceae bacterium]|nr:hypothetical protein [Bryobacteraceae bacterium]